MKKTCLLLMLLSLLLCGCGKTAAVPSEMVEDNAVETEETVPATIPADGNPGDVTCKGSYTAEAGGGVVAAVGNAELTDQELQVWYWAEVSQYRQEKHEIAPDFDRPLDTQPCGIDDSVATWQQYFLREALNAWHSAKALLIQSETVPLATEEAYQPNKDNHEKYLTGMPATQYLYGYSEYYKPNSMHQAYLDGLADTLDGLAAEKGYSGAADMAKSAFAATEQALKDYADTRNRAYMYFTELSYDIEPTDDEIAAFYAENAAAYSTEGTCVDIRHILLVPDGTKDMETCKEEAEELLTYWQKKTKATEATFAELANKNSQDSGTALDGGAYHRIRKGQLMEALDSWCFDSERQAGDTTIIQSKNGVHILYFAGSTDTAYVQAEEDYYRQAQRALIAQAREVSPMEVDYNAITLGSAEAAVAAGELLYPDVAHERFPEIPLYLQQDYPNTKYGAYKITTNGCGITSFAMLASYMTDDEMTPPEMCALYGGYSHSNGTDGMIFINEPPVLGFYLRERTFDVKAVRAALEEGYVAISIQHPGYWTRGGHYIVLESITEDGMVQVRDSNIYNYGKLRAHKEDLHEWWTIPQNGSGYWVFENKITSIPACSRCGTGEDSVLTEAYCCHKCGKALLRRNTYLSNAE